MLRSQNGTWSLMSVYRDETITCWECQKGQWSLMSVYRDETIPCWEFQNGQWTLMSVYRDGTITCRNGWWFLMSKCRDETMTCWVLPIHSYVSIEMQQWYIGSQNGTWSLMSVYRDENMSGMWESPVAVLDFSTGPMAHSKWTSVWARKINKLILGVQASN